MKVWGLTGGIATGKSTVARMFAERGAHVLDADAVYHKLIEPQQGQPSPLARSIADQFGADMLLPDGSVDRARLGQHVFANPTARGALEALTHPAVAAGVQASLQAWREAGVQHAIYDVPLLYERGLQQAMHGVAVVWVPEAVQRARLEARSGVAGAEADKRLAAQMPLEEKRRQARWVIDNSGTLEATAQQVDAVWTQMQAG